MRKCLSWGNGYYGRNRCRSRWLRHVQRMPIEREADIMLYGPPGRNEISGTTEEKIVGRYGRFEKAWSAWMEALGPGWRVIVEQIKDSQRVLEP